MRWAYSPETHDLIPVERMKWVSGKRPVIWLDEDGVYAGWSMRDGRYERVAGPFNNVEEAKLAAEMVLV